MNSVRANQRLASGILACTLAAPAMAAPVLEEIFVTAQKREEGLQEAPISLAVFGEDAIERLGISNVGDIGANVPNVMVTTFGVSPTSLRFYIRGIGTSDAQVTQDPPVAIYMDGIYLARNSALTLDVADIQRIEVLRGPQGTLYGRNTTGGAINVITARPDGEFGFKQNFSFGNYDFLRSRTIVDFPLGERLAAKFAYEHNQRGGWIDNIGAGDDFNKYDKDALRGSLRWTASDNFTVDYTYDRSQNDFTGNYYHIGEPNAFAPATIVPQTSRVSRAALPTRFKRSSEEGSGHVLQLTWDLPIGEVKSITGYRELEQFIYNDYSGNPVTSVFTNDPFDLEHDQFSQEIQLVGSNTDASINYAAGVFYFSEEGREVALDQLPLFGVLLPRDVTAENKATAVYAELGWTPGGNSDWTVIVGGRYSEDERKGDNTINPEVKEDFNNFSPSLTVKYSVNDEVNLYGKVSSGYKSGGFNLRAAFFTESFNEETLISYELGWKTELMDRRLRFNGALFYMDYDDLQLNILVPNQPNPTLTQTQNAGTAEIWGLESDITVAITQRLTASLSYGYLNTEVVEVEGDDANLWDLANSPENSLTTNLSWAIAELSVGVLQLDADYSWKDDASTASRATTGAEIKAYGIGNIRFSLTGQDWFGKGEFTVAGWVRNLTDEEYLTDTFGSFSGIHANQIGAYGEPRTYGIDLNYRF